MCLIVWAYDCHPRYRLILAANRDEFYARASLAAGYWPDRPLVLGGRDLAAGGTWLAVSRSGRLAAVTNYRDPAAHNPKARSRGELVAEFVDGRESLGAYLESVHSRCGQYNGFNLLAADPQQMAYLGSRNGPVREVAPGVHGLSNHLLDTPWSKVAGGRVGLERLLTEDGVTPENLLNLLCDRRQPADVDLPDTGIGLEWERILAPRFIVSPTYGTRSATVVLWERASRIGFWEWTFVPGQDPPRVAGKRHFQFSI